MTTPAMNGQALRVARTVVVNRDGNVCRRCRGRIDLTLSGLDPDGLTLGHIVARANGGTDAIGNLAPEHRRCNLAAGASADAPAAAIAVPYEVPRHGDPDHR